MCAICSECSSNPCVGLFLCIGFFSNLYNQGSYQCRWLHCFCPSRVFCCILTVLLKYINPTSNIPISADFQSKMQIMAHEQLDLAHLLQPKICLFQKSDVRIYHISQQYFSIFHIFQNTHRWISCRNIITNQSSLKRKICIDYGMRLQETLIMASFVACCCDQVLFPLVPAAGCEQLYTS